MSDVGALIDECQHVVETCEDLKRGVGHVNEQLGKVDTLIAHVRSLIDQAQALEFLYCETDDSRLDAETSHRYVQELRLAIQRCARCDEERQMFSNDYWRCTDCVVAMNLIGETWL